MTKLSALALALLASGCYSAHAPADPEQTDACAVEWVCTGTLADDDVCEGLMIAIDPCHAAPEDEGTYERVGSWYEYEPAREGERPVIR